MQSKITLSQRRLAEQKGAVTISYLWPGTTVPLATANPDGIPQSTIVATVTATAAADTSAVITHQFNLTPAEITQGFPRLTLVPQADPEITSNWYEASEAPNYTVLQKNTTAAGVKTKVFISRPWQPEK
jgi:hypothetical protein